MKPFLLLCLVLSTAGFAQQPVAVGRGSYASSPPPGSAVDGPGKQDLVAAVEGRKLFLVKDDGRPIPTNKWYQNLLLKEFGTGLWAMPHLVDATREGLEIFQPNSFSGDGVRTIAEFPLVVTGRGFKPVDSRAKDWTDWTVSFRSCESDTRFMDVTLGEGMPAVWCEFTGVQPLIALGGQHGKGSRGKGAAKFFNLAGSAATLPASGDTLGITYEGRSFGVFAPDGTRFEQTEAGIAVTFPGKASFLTLCPLPSEKDIGTFHRHAFAVPRETRLSWDYNREAGTLTSTWKIRTDPLKPGAEDAVIQGFLPHLWREDTLKPNLGGPSYTTIRGPLKCGAGNTFTFSHPFNGILPNLPAPSAKSFETKRIQELLARHYSDPKKNLGGDTYWGGKELERYAQAAFIADQTADPSKAAVLGTIRRGLENWLTYTPGEAGQFFAFYPRHKALVGFPSAYGSEHFTDTHFHQGYFVYAAGLLCQLQPDFAAGYGDMARLVAKNFANYDRADTRFPRFRTFDLWRGHGFADGKGFPEGNNQESTGEAVNAWAGMILLGEALGDKELTAAGVMGYTFETRANVEYWFDPHGDVFPKDYAHNACGMIWSSSIVWGTWFTASPSWIYGIQWLPSGPHAAFYDRDPEFVGKVYADAEREQKVFEEREASKKAGATPKAVGLKSLEGELGSYHLGFLMQADPGRVVTELDRLWAEPGDKVAHNEWMMATYWQASALTELGRVDWSCHGSSPTAMVYAHPVTKRRTLVAWNPTAQPQTVRFVSGSKPIGQLTVPPHSLSRAVTE